MQTRVAFKRWPDWVDFGGAALLFWVGHQLSAIPNLSWLGSLMGFLSGAVFVQAFYIPFVESQQAFIGELLKERHEQPH